MIVSPKNGRSVPLECGNGVVFVTEEDSPSSPPLIPVARKVTNGCFVEVRPCDDKIVTFIAVKSILENLGLESHVA
jgi:hypothetical protein